MSDWDAGRARRLYNIDHWAEGCYDVGDDGRLRVMVPGAGPGPALAEVVAAARARGLAPPVLLRFPHLLRHRVDRLCRAFDAAMAAEGYGGGYTAVYPVKVNQQRRVVEVIARHPGRRVGLEAGSKPELMAVLAAAAGDEPVICNGYKDRAYVRLALLGQRLGHRVYLVVEKLSELELVIEESARLGLAPRLGLRVRLASIGAGKWQNTGGEKSKFGLSAAEVIRAVERLRAAGLDGRLQLLHVHLGSQVPNIRDFQKGLGELGRYYCALRRMGLPVEMVDVGGGLGVDYEGTRSRSFCSMNYTVEEYAHNVVHTLAALCRAEDLPPPHLITEAGRAMTAHHAVLVTDVIEVERVPEGRPPDGGGEAPAVLRDLEQVLARLEARSLLESYHDAAHALAEAHAQFNLGLLDLAQRARAEHLHLAACRAIQARLRPELRAHREVLDELEERLADKYFCNFSLFQSVPDVWAIHQIFPVVPLQRLDEPPARRAVLKDLTCDSDGRIDDYVVGDGVRRSLPLHAPHPGEPYLLGIFLVGAYQEILGDMHNLFGDTHAVDVELGEGGFELVAPQRGDTVASVLRYVHFDPAALRDAYAGKLAARGLDGAGARDLLAELEAGLEAYTYLDNGG